MDLKESSVEEEQITEKFVKHKMARQSISVILELEMKCLFKTQYLKTGTLALLANNDITYYFNLSM